MSRINELESHMAAALDRLRTAVVSRRSSHGGADGEEGALASRVAELEREKAALAGELERLRAKRDMDVAALDELIAQLKPLIEEV
jgi:hypothetical protein